MGLVAPWYQVPGLLLPFHFSPFSRWLSPLCFLFCSCKVTLSKQKGQRETGEGQESMPLKEGLPPSRAFPHSEKHISLLAKDCWTFSSALQLSASLMT